MNRPLIMALALLAGSTVASAQKNASIDAGLLRAQLTLAPSYLFAEQQAYFYLHGTLETYLSDRFSIAGEGYTSLGSIGNEYAALDEHHSIFFGSNWHFVKGGSDLYLGVHPGVSFTKLDHTTGEVGNAKTSVNPMISAVAGYNYFFHRYFHFFLQTRIGTGQHAQYERMDLTEVRLSAGLGWNVNMKH